MSSPHEVIKAKYGGVDFGPITRAPRHFALQIPFQEDLPPEEARRLAEKTVDDFATAPSASFGNFPENIPAAVRQKLNEYQDAVLNYRSWASLIWANSVYNNPNLPQDPSDASRLQRTSYFARIADYHMRNTPWLAFRSDIVKSQVIDTETRNFHTELITAVLGGFIGLPSSVLSALDAILKSISQTLTISKASTHYQVIISERYEYEPISDRIRSFILLTLFEIGQEAYEVNNAKHHVERVKCTISYTEYQVEFVHSDWLRAAESIEEYKKQAMEDFVNDQLINLPP